MVGASEERSETSLGICPGCKVKENYADMMVTEWNLRERVLATHASWSIECMMRSEVWSA